MDFRPLDPERDPNGPLSEWRYFMCATCELVHESWADAHSCCDGRLLPRLVVPVDDDPLDDELRALRGES
ncbi:MAG: hypothetical protein ABR575_07605 [Actinomycetota bacterium]